MASLISWLSGGAKRVANTLNNDVIQPINRDVVKPVTPLVKQIANPVGGLLKQTYQTANRPVNQVRADIASLTHNSAAYNNAMNQVNQGNPLPQAIGIARSVPQTAIKIGLSANPFTRPGVGKETFTPNTSLQKLLLGNQPIKSFGTQAQETQRQSGTGAAIGQQLVDAINAAGSLQGAKVAVEKGAPIVENAVKSLPSNYKANPTLSSQAGSVPLGKPKATKPTPEKLASLKALEYAKDPNSFDAKGNFKAPIQKELNDIMNGKTPKPSSTSSAPVVKNYRPRLPVEPTKNVNPVVAKLATKPTVLDKIGTPSSQLAASKIRAIDKMTGDLRAGYRNTSRTVLDLSPEEINNLGNVREHGAQPMNARVAQALTEASSTLPKVRGDYVGTGGKTGNIESFFPRDYSGLKKGTSTYNTALQHLLDTGQAKSTGEAASILDRLRSGNTSTKPGFFGSFDRSRYDVPGYTYSRTAYEKYLNGAARKTAESTHFGPKGEIAKQLVGKIAREGGNAQLANKAISNYLHDASIGKTDYAAPARAVFGVARFGKAAVSHLGQGSNIKLYTRVADHLKAQAQWLSRNPEAKRFIEESDVNNPENIHGYAQQYSSLKGIASKATAPALEPVMKAHRGVAALAGRSYGNYLARTGNVAELRQKWGVTGEIGKTLTRAQEGEIARSMADTTMGSSSRATTPIGAETPTGKTIGQARTAFAYKQTGRIYDQVVKEAGKGNLKPLGKFLAFSVPTGVATIAVKSAISGNNSWQQEGPGGKALDALAALGGVPGELAVQGARYAKGNLLKTAAGAVAPVAGEAVDLAQRAQSALKGNYKPLIRYGAGLAPVVGSRLANTLAPSAPKATGSGNTSLDQAIQQVKDSSKQPGGKWEDNIPKEDAAIAELNGTQQQALIGQGKITQSDVDRAKRLEAAAKQLLAPSKAIDTTGLTGADTSFLQRYNRLSATGQDKFNNDPSNQLQMGQIKYTQDKAKGNLTQAQDINRTQALAKLKVNAMKDDKDQYQFSKDTITGYSLTKAEAADIFNAPGGQAFANNLVAYGDALVKAGAIASNKWRDSKGNVSLFAKSGSGSSKSFSGSFKTAAAVKAPKPPKISVKKLAAPALQSVKKLSVSKIPSSYINRKLG